MVAFSQSVAPPSSPRVAGLRRERSVAGCGCGDAIHEGGPGGEPPGGVVP
jgi:hypothetical protein